MQDASFCAGKILLMDDLPETLALLVDGLRQQHYEIDFADTTAKAINALKEKRYDVAILDPLMCPSLRDAFDKAFPEMADSLLVDQTDEKSQGFGVAHWLRENQPDVGVIMLTGNYFTKEHLLFGLNVGADDYIEKTEGLDPSIFAGRVRALIRRCRPFDEAKISHKDFDLYLKPQKIVSKTGGIAYLTDAEFMTLKLLILNRNDIVTRERILTYCKTQAAKEQHKRAVDTLVSKLREKLESSGIDDPPIRTLRGRGYLFEDVLAYA